MSAPARLAMPCGREFKDVGVLICDSEGSDLSKRRDLRRQRRTLRSKKYRRQWFAKELVKLGLPKPEHPPNDPISLRLRALNGEALKPEELHAALTHLFKRRGYTKCRGQMSRRPPRKMPSQRRMTRRRKSKRRSKRSEQKLDGKHPCQFLVEEKARVGKSPTTELGAQNLLAA